MKLQWCPKCQEHVTYVFRQYQIEENLKCTETLCAKCQLIISTFTETVKKTSKTRRANWKT